VQVGHHDDVDRLASNGTREQFLRARKKIARGTDARIDEERHIGVEAGEEGQHPGRSAHPLPAPVEDERSSALRAALAALPERDRELLMLTAWEGLTPKQIAAVVGTPANLVRVRLHRPRKRLKRDLANPRPPIAPRAGYAAARRDR
jgi:RNA polymerase sigma factor (sigma-70 family)